MGFQILFPKYSMIPESLWIDLFHYYGSVVFQSIQNKVELWQLDFSLLRYGNFNMRADGWCVCSIWQIQFREAIFLWGWDIFLTKNILSLTVKNVAVETCSRLYVGIMGALVPDDDIGWYVCWENYFVL